MMKIAVVGAGPVGIITAKLLLNSKSCQVFLLDSGKQDSEFHLSKSDYTFLTPCKLTPGVHTPGGGTNYWKGRVSRFPRTAIESVDSSGNRIWPFEWEDVEQSFNEIESLLGLSIQEVNGYIPDIHTCTDCAEGLLVSPYNFIKVDTFKLLLKDMVGSENFHFWPGVFCHRIVGSSDKPQTIEYFSDKKRLEPRTLSVDHVFVAAGCLQSTALIQRSFPTESKIYPVGRYLQEHFDGYIGRIIVKKGNVDCLERMSLSEQRKLPNAEIGIGVALNHFRLLHYHLEITPLVRTYVFDPAVNRFNLPKPIIRILFHMERLFSFPIERTTRFLHRIFGHRPYSVWLKGEEMPNFESKVYIDRLKTSHVIYGHKVSKATMKHMRKELRLFASFIKSRKMGRFSFAPHLWIPGFISTGGNWHPMGSLRMHNSQESVVNKEFTLNWNKRIFVVDSSTFPAGAHHNPTSMAICLANIAVRNFLDGFFTRNE